MIVPTRLTAGLCVAGLISLSGCGGGGGDGDRLDFPFEDRVAAQASVGVIRSTLSILIGLRSEDSSVGTSGSSCTAGSVDSSCEVENRISILRGSFDECRVPLANGNRITADGSLRIETSDLGVCVTGRVPDTATLNLRYGTFEQILADSNGNELMRLILDGTDRVVPSGTGCAGRDITETLDATSDQVVSARAPGRLAADGVDAEVRARNLELTQTSAGAVCERTIVANGEMQVEDRANGLRYTQTVAGLSIAYTEEDDYALISIDGSLVNECVGDVAVVMTVEPLRIHSANECPTGGVLRLTIGAKASIATFGPQGQMSIEAEDGTFLVVGSSCLGGGYCSL